MNEAKKPQARRGEAPELELRVSRTERKRGEHSARTLQHVGVGVLGDGEHVRRDLVAPVAAVFADAAGRVDGQPRVRVDGHAEQARIGLHEHKHSIAMT